MCTSLCIELLRNYRRRFIYIGARAYFSERELWSQSIINMSTTGYEMDPVHGRVEVMRDTSWIGWSTPVYPRTKPSRFSNSQSTKRSSKRYKDRIRRESHLETEWCRSKRYRATYARMVCCPRRAHHGVKTSKQLPNEQFIRDKLKDKPFLGSTRGEWNTKRVISLYLHTRDEYGLLHHPAHLGASPTVSHHTGSWSEMMSIFQDVERPRRILNFMRGQLFMRTPWMWPSFVAWGCWRIMWNTWWILPFVLPFWVGLHHSMMDLSNFLR
jgi:hypothetical protein